MFRKWSPPSKLFAALGIVFSLAAFVLVRGYASRVVALKADLGRPVAVAVATKPLARGTVLQGSMLELREFPSAYAPPGALRSVDSALGRALVTPLAEGEPLTVDRLAPKGAGPVAALVPPGLRAVEISTSLAGDSIRAGDRVDVLATFPGPHAHTETVASGLEVLRVVAGGTASAPDLSSAAPGSTATQLLLLVTPDQTEQLAYARAFADLSVALDGPQEVTPAQGP